MKSLLLSFLISFSAFGKGFVPSSFSANFEESIISKATGKERKSFGKVDYKFPSNIRFEVVSPEASLFVSNPLKSWYYLPPFISGEQGQVTIQKSSKLPLTKFLDSIREGVEGSKMFTPKYQGKDLILTFTKTSREETGLKEVILHGTKDAKAIQKLSEFEKLTLVKADGQTVNLKFIDLKEDPSFQPRHFEFTVPDKTKIING